MSSSLRRESYWACHEWASTVSRAMRFQAATRVPTFVNQACDDAFESRKSRMRLAALLSGCSLPNTVLVLLRGQGVSDFRQLPDVSL